MRTKVTLIVAVLILVCQGVTIWGNYQVKEEIKTIPVQQHKIDSLESEIRYRDRMIENVIKNTNLDIIGVERKSK